jgi:hypothetical protein
MDPVAVWDARHLRFGEVHPAVQHWIEGEGIDPNETYRVEVYLLDAPFARVFTYASEPGRPPGWRYWDEATGWAAVNDPYDKPVSGLPPEAIRVVLG